MTLPGNIVFFTTVPVTRGLRTGETRDAVFVGRNEASGMSASGKSKERMGDGGGG